ncbi:hypothetical protein CWT12_09165 [Actinomyces sp. 432]|nr:DUF4129 domain-containing protein [Actinomyces sp. 594]NDR52575.1 DUF4129 domain-containing protein [Actinomyces sp. 565]QHO92291.1 hypothetical protein CWT12_09165 [Actinomyces sp. 432]
MPPVPAAVHVPYSGRELCGLPPLDVPATPDADTARRAAEKELAKPAYHHAATLWERAWRWLAEHLDPRGAVPGVPSWLSVLIVVVLVLALVVALGVMFTRITWARRARRAHGVLFEDDRDASALTRAANAAAAQGDWATAVIERFRAVVRTLDERGALEDYPGMTAHEAAGLAARPLGELAAEMDEAARLFDSVRYGSVVSTPSQDAWMREFAERVTRAPLALPTPARQVTP